MRKHSGFTLIELMVVVAIVSVIAVLTFTQVRFLDGALMRAEVDKLYGMCMYAQRCAMLTNKKQVIIVDKAAKSYTYNGRCERLPDAIDFGFIAGVKGPPSDPRGDITSPITFKDDQIIFKPNGIIQPGSIYLVDTQKKSMYGLSSSVAQVSFLRKYRYDKKWGLL
ncbi:MAG: prepilin-type N-terminal cleavage/methylation domain-containing protein [Candidatus Dependentiae bacterium]|nr:prepilin-type N-terminal cleavage/methylation domain-containing protein [Candidatus Dependentiae bacterium]